MSRYFFPFILIFAFWGCYHDSPEPSFDLDLVLPRDSMVVILTDLQLTDGAVNLKSRGNQRMEEFSSAYTSQVLEKHGISRETFTESIRYYSFYIEELDKIYEEVIIRLGTIESEAYKKD